MRCFNLALSKSFYGAESDCGIAQTMQVGPRWRRKQFSRRQLGTTRRHLRAGSRQNSVAHISGIPTQRCSVFCGVDVKVQQELLRHTEYLEQL